MTDAQRLLLKLQRHNMVVSEDQTESSDEINELLNHDDRQVKSEIFSSLAKDLTTGLLADDLKPQDKLLLTGVYRVNKHKKYLGALKQGPED